MSSGSYREVPTGVIHQGNKVVGCIVMPDAEFEEVFIREFNHCYGQLRMSIAPTPDGAAFKKEAANPYTFQIPTWFRHVWHATHTLEETPDPAAAPTPRVPPLAPPRKRRSNG